MVFDQTRGYRGLTKLTHKIYHHSSETSVRCPGIQACTQDRHSSVIAANGECEMPRASCGPGTVGEPHFSPLSGERMEDASPSGKLLGPLQSMTLYTAVSSLQFPLCVSSTLKRGERLLLTSSPKDLRAQNLNSPLKGRPDGNWTGHSS